VERNIWRTATASQENGSCIEVMITDHAVLVRDTKDKGQGPVHTYTYPEWTAFLDGVNKGEFDID
jgi:hypothetical protein